VDPKIVTGDEFWDSPLVGHQSKIEFFVVFNFFSYLGFLMLEIAILLTAVIEPIKK